MHEILRAAQRNLLRVLSALLAFARSASSSLLTRLRPGPAALRDALRSWVERLPDVIESVRIRSAELLQQLADTIAPGELGVPGAPAPEQRAQEGDQDFADMLADLGAEAPAPVQGVDPTLAETTIRALTGDLHGLRDLGDQLARAEQDKLALAARVEELEAVDAHEPHASVARLERKLEQREEVLTRERERLGAQRAKTDEWKRKAAERWHEIRALRKQVGELERTLANASDASQPGALPQRSAVRARPKPRARR